MIILNIQQFCLKFIYSSHSKSTKYQLLSHWSFASVENFLTTVIYVFLSLRNSFSRYI